MAAPTKREGLPKTRNPGRGPIAGAQPRLWSQTKCAGVAASPLLVLHKPQGRPGAEEEAGNEEALYHPVDPGAEPVPRKILKHCQAAGGVRGVGADKGHVPAACKLVAELGAESLHAGAARHE